MTATKYSLLKQANSKGNIEIYLKCLARIQIVQCFTLTMAFFEVEATWLPVDLGRFKQS